jgi:hypothetical protein
VACVTDKQAFNVKRIFAVAADLPGFAVLNDADRKLAEHTLG